MKKLIATLTGCVTAETAFSGKSKFEFWQEIQPGDEIEISYELKHDLWYKPQFTLKNKRTGKDFKEAQNVIFNYLYKVL